MEYKNLIPIFKKVKPSLNFNEQYIFKRKINQRKNDINILFSNFHTEEEKKLKQLKIRFPIRKSIIKHKRISSIEFDNNINNIIDNFTERKQIKESLYDKIKLGYLEYFDYVKSENNSLGEVIKDYCNFRKKLVKTPNGHKSIVVRAGFFQGGVQEWTACLRAAFCSSDVNAQKFASNFIEESSHRSSQALF